MSNKKSNEELQNRREFFKKAAKAALPVIGAVVLANVPIAKSKAATGCDGYCYTGCASSCDNGCFIGCRGGCDDYCNSTCVGGCYVTCDYGCKSTCEGQCRGTCIYGNMY